MRKMNKRELHKKREEFYNIVSKTGNFPTSFMWRTLIKSNAEIISVDARKWGILIREAWYSGPVSLNRHMTLQPAFKAIQLREQSRKRQHTNSMPDRNDYGSLDSGQQRASEASDQETSESAEDDTPIRPVMEENQPTTMEKT